MTASEAEDIFYSMFNAAAVIVREQRWFGEAGAQQRFEQMIRTSRPNICA